MIGIKINGEFPDIFPDTAISLKLVNPVFADDTIIPGSYSLPFDIPGGESSDNNARIINHPDVIENTTGRFEFDDAELHIDGLLYKTGTLLIQQAEGGKYSANFRFSLKNIRSDFKRYKIRDLVDEDIIITSADYYKKAVVKYGVGVSSPYKLIVNGDTYEGATLGDLATAIDASVYLAASYVNTGSTFGVSGDRVEVEPAVLPTMVSQEFTVKFDSEQDVDGSDIVSDPQTTFLTAYAAWLDLFYGVPPKDYLFIPMMRNFITGEIDDMINEVTATGYDFGRLTDIPQKGEPYMPFVTLKRVFDTIETEFGITFKGTFFDDPEYPKALWYHTKSMWTDMEYIKGVEYRFYDDAFNVRDLVPDINIEELLKGLQQKHNLSVIISDTGREITINYRKATVLAKGYTDWTAISGAIDPVNYKETHSGIRLEGAVDDNDELDEKDNYSIGNPGKVISSIIGSINNDFSIDGFDMPHVNQAYDSDFIPRLFFYVGITDNAGLDYQEASYKGMETHYGGTGALGESQWKDYLRFLMNKKVIPVTVELEYRHLNVIDWEEKVMIDGIRYFIKSIDVKLTAHGIEPAKVELYKVV